MSEKRFSVGIVIVLVLLGVGIAAGSMVSGVFLGYQWGRSAGRSHALTRAPGFMPRGVEPFLGEVLPQFGLPELRRVERPFLGVSFQMVTEELARQEDLGADQGAWVTQVVPGSPAAEAGLQEGDLIQQVDEQDVDGKHPLPDLINAHQPGDRIELAVLRGRRELRVEVELGTRPGGYMMEEGLIPGENFPRFHFQFHCFPEPCPHFEDRP
jgi:membrane-associated protease RseP (regulator of RpoE activity)